MSARGAKRSYCYTIPSLPDLRFFLSVGLMTGDCLLDAPEKTLPLPTELPGLTYSLDRQCQQVFGEEFSYCRNSSAAEVCSQLWCQQEGQSMCTTRNGSLAWADGTECAPNRTCLDGVCTATEEIMKLKVKDYM